MKVAILLAGMALTAFGQRPPFTVEDMWVWRTPSDPRIRADGKWVVYSEGFLDRAADLARANLWLASSDGRERRQWTDGPWRDWSPRWSPDGERVAWISDRGGQPHVRVRRFDATAEVELRMDGAVLAFAWSAEGDRIAFTGRSAVKAQGPAWAPPSVLPRLVRPDPAPQVFVALAAGGAARSISRATSGCEGEPSWTLDGKSVIAVCDDAIVALPSDGGAGKVLAKDGGRYESPVVSPDGGRIAFLLREKKPQTYVVRKLWVMNADGSRARSLSGSLDRDASWPQWSSESRTVYFLADDRGATHVYASRNDGTVRQATNNAERLEGFSLADNGRAVSIRSGPREAGVVLSFTVDTPSQPVALTDPNGRLLAEREISTVEEIAYDSDGIRVQGWLVKPPTPDPARKFPLVVDAADDPRRMYGVEFSLRAQILAARGVAVLLANPRGAPGYGEQFGHLLKTRYPGDDLDDLLRGVDATIAKGLVDPERVSIAGGLTAAWAIGHTARFHRAVARRPTVVGTGLPPWEDPEQFVKRSPLLAAESFRIPTLILAPSGDAQADQLFRALQARKVAAEWLLWDGERPSDRVVEIDAILGWLGQGAR